MADIYDYETGDEITAGLQGSVQCDEAIIEAHYIADRLGRPVLLVDDGEETVVYPRDHELDS